MSSKTYYLVFTVDRIPDLTLTKYSVLDGSSVDDIMEKHGVFLRQLHRLGSTSNVYFHLLYYFDPDERIKKGHHLSVIFYATSTERRKLEGIREFLTTSVLSTYYDFHCYEVSTEFRPDIIIRNESNTEHPVNLKDIYSELDSTLDVSISPSHGLLSVNKYVFGKKIQFSEHDGNTFLRLFKNTKENNFTEYPLNIESFKQNQNLISMLMNDVVSCNPGEMFICYFDLNGNYIEDIEKQRVQCVVDLKNVSGNSKRYGIGEKDISIIETSQEEIKNGVRPSLTFELASDGDAVLGYNGLRAYDNGQVLFMRKHVLAKRIRFINNQLWLYAAESEDSDCATFEYDKNNSFLSELPDSLTAPEGTMFLCYFNGDTNIISEIKGAPVPCDNNGNIISITEDMEKKFSCLAYLTKKDYYLPAQNRLDKNDREGEVRLYSIMEWEPCEDGRLYNVLKLMEGYNRTVALRIDIFPVEQTQLIREKMLPYSDTRKRISKRDQGKDDNSENIIKSWDKYLQNLMKFPQFFANVVAFADSTDIAVMLADSVAAEAVESGTYRVESDESSSGFSIYYGDNIPLNSEYWEKRDSKQLIEEDRNIWYRHIRMLLSLYTLEELRPMFSFPILYPGESIECLKETDPKPNRNHKDPNMSLGISSLGYDVEFIVKNFVKHAFIAGVPGAGKTNTMLHLVTSLWRRDRDERVPFLVLEPAKQEYRALAKIEGMEELRIFSPGADTYFPLHINPFQFPVGLTLAEHIANLNAVFAGAFELPPPSPHFIDSCIEKVYLDKGWNVNERNVLDENGNYLHDFPTLQELYSSLEVAVKNSHYQGETLGNLQSVLEVRVGSLLKREIGNVYNVRDSIIKPEDWLDVPAIIELESLGEGPANFMSLLISTLIRETLKVRKTSADESGKKTIKPLNHVIFYEEAHNLIGPDTDSPVGDSVDPKISATKYVVKMLAEVRALREGIVIADQLPTVMAPEVLKNTGLKIAHRITAQDDRNLLGSTMSASADQLEEQGTFDTGWALIFYEGLLKPYKMRIHEWDAQNRDPNKYESPTNKQLFNYLRNNPIYRATLQKSANIMAEKMNVEFQLLFDRSIKLKKTIKDEVYYLKELQKGIERQQNAESFSNHIKNSKDKVVDVPQQILAFKNRKISFITKTSRDLKTLCWDFCNEYFATITLAKNYDFAANDLYCNAINGFTNLFAIMKSLTDVQEFSSIIVSETNSAMKDMERFVTLDSNKNAVLSNHEKYPELQYQCCYYWLNEIYTRTVKLVSKAKRIVEMENNRERNINDFCKDWTNQFFYLKDKADTVAKIVDTLVAGKKMEADWSYIEDPEKYESIMKEINEIEKHKFDIYKILHLFVIHPVNHAFIKLQGSDCICFLKSTKALRDAYMEIVNYRDGDARTKLFEYYKYQKLRKDAAVLVNMDLLARVDVTQTERMMKLDQLLISTDANEKEKIIREIISESNNVFKMYRKRDVEGSEYYVNLLNFYFQFMDKMMNLGTFAINLMLSDEDTQYEIFMCSRIMQSLKSKQHIGEEQKTTWNRIFTRWIGVNKNMNLI